MNSFVHLFFSGWLTIEYITTLSHHINDSFMLDSCITSAFASFTTNSRQQMTEILIISDLLLKKATINIEHWALLGWYHVLRSYSWLILLRCLLLWLMLLLLLLHFSRFITLFTSANTNFLFRFYFRENHS